MKSTWQQLIGVDDSHLCQLEYRENSNQLVHPEVKIDLQRLLHAAEDDGVTIAIVSSYRSFERQLTIWNEKWQGHRAVVSRHGRTLNLEQLSDIEKYKAICLWSALPGLSRHHWGTDFDIFSQQAIDEGHKVALSPSEFSKGNVCSELNDWLDTNLSRFGFFRPYLTYRQGVSDEPWHISHQSTTHNILNNFPYEECRNWIEKSEIKSRDFIINHLDHYREKYFLNICPENSENE
jgi:LAS superfamily LD-carboxypeptidase LdcB